MWQGFNKRAWSEGWKAGQIIIADFLLAALIILFLSGIVWLLESEWVGPGLDQERRAIIEAVYFWYALSVLVLAPVKSVWTLLGKARDSRAPRMAGKSK